MIPCRECNQDSGWTQELIDSPLFGGNVDVAVCDDCCENYHREQKAEQNLPRVDHAIEPIENLIPMGYRESSISKLPISAQQMLPEIMKWSPLRKKGLYIMGASRQGKTRSLCMLLQELHSQGRRFKVFFAGDFHTQLIEAKRSAFFRSWRDEIVSVPILAIDDLFAEKMSPTTQAGLFEIIEARMARQLPLLCTTQVKRSDAVKSFDDPHRGQALLARLRETCDLVVMNKKQVMQEEVQFT
jgi:DNA replication protein DnaC